MEELYRQVDKYSMLEDNIHVAAQTVMITNQPAKGNESSGKRLSESKEGQVKTDRGPVIRHKRGESFPNSPPTHLIQEVTAHHSRLPRV